MNFDEDEEESDDDEILDINEHNAEEEVDQHYLFILQFKLHFRMDNYFSSTYVQARLSTTTGDNNKEQGG